MMKRSLPTLPRPSTLQKQPLGVLQRACVCGTHSHGKDDCAKCKEERFAELRRFPSRPRTDRDVPPIVYHVLRSPGEPLRDPTRAAMEARFGHDFSHVRVHTNSTASQSTEAVDALAYTVGRDVVFRTGLYQPTTLEGRKLLAHELTHVVQQGRSDSVPLALQVGSSRDPREAEAQAFANAAERPISATHGPAQRTPIAPPNPAAVAELRRACLPAADCTAPRSTLTEFVAETEKKPENITKAEKREKACTKVPRDPSCTSDGHGATATALTAMLKSAYASRVGYVTGIYVHKDMPATWGAVTMSCSDFMPPLPGGQCTFVPDTLEATAKLYQGGAKTVGGLPRQDWLTRTIGTLTHETEHARFDTAAPLPEPSPAACKFADLEANLSELAAHLSQMHVYYRAALALPEQGRFKRFYGMFDFWVRNGSEDIGGIVKELRCKCECADADHYISKTAESVSTNQKWDSNEKTMIHTELQEPKWGLKWPVAPPAAVDLKDLPTVSQAPLKFE
jgi:uncharacterized protein DUF4157